MSDHANNQVILFGDTRPGFARPPGIYVLASFLRKNNIKVQPVWGFSYIPIETFDKICRKFLNNNVKVVGISTTLLTDKDYNTNNTDSNFFGCSTDELVQRLALIRQLAPHAKIVVGGSQVMYDALPTGPENEYIDLYIKGQGEQVLLELVNSNESLKTESILPPTVSDKMYPYNHFSATPTMYRATDCILPGETLGLEFARGCIFKCSFCSYALTGKKYGDYTKTKDTLVRELIYNYYNHGTTHYFVTDDLINDSEEKVDMLLDVSRSLPFKLSYTAFMRLDLIRRYPNTAAKLKESGLIGCFFGIETIDDSSGKKVGKGLGLDRINEAVTICNEAWKGEVVGQGSFILGLPGHTPETKHELMEWLETPEVRKLIKYITVYPLNIVPGLGISDIDKNPEKYGYREDDSNLPKMAVRYGHTYMNWRTDTYRFYQALLDANEVKRTFQANRPYVSKWSGGIFRMAYLLGLSQHKEEMMSVFLNGTATMWPTPESWQNYLENIQAGYRDTYLKLLLGE